MLAEIVFLQIFRILLGINVRVLFILLLLGLGAIFYMGARTSPIIVFVISVCILSFLVSIYLIKWVLAKDEGPPEMVQVNLFPTIWFIQLLHSGKYSPGPVNIVNLTHQSTTTKHCDLNFTNLVSPLDVFVLWFPLGGFLQLCGFFSRIPYRILYFPFLI